MAICIASPLSRQHIRAMAMFIRKVDKSENMLFFDIVKFLDVVLPKMVPNFSLVIEGRDKMGECHGLTFPDRDEIHIREDVYIRASNGSGRDRLTMAHELFHLLQHEKRNISYARMEAKEQVKVYMDPEWQADAFGGELLIPAHLIKNMTVDEIVDKCKVSWSAAEYQLYKCN